MNMKIAAFVIVGASVYGITKIINSYRKDDISTRILFLWVFLWSGIGAFALFPSMLDTIMRLVNMGNRLFFITISAILILFVIVSHVTSHMLKMSRKVSRLVQKIAILDYKLEMNLKESSARDNE